MFWHLSIFFLAHNNSCSVTSMSRGRNGRINNVIRSWWSHQANSRAAGTNEKSAGQHQCYPVSPMYIVHTIIIISIFILVSKVQYRIPLHVVPLLQGSTHLLSHWQVGNPTWWGTIVKLSILLHEVWKLCRASAFKYAGSEIRLQQKLVLLINYWFMIK